MLFVIVTFMLPGCKWFSSNCEHCHDHQTTETKNKSSIIKITSMQEFQEKVISSTKPVVVDFSAAWCGACQTIKPTFEKIAQDLASKYLFVEVDVDAAGQIANNYNIKGIPTITFFKNGKEVVSEANRIVGTIDENALKATIEKYLE